jgi:hypothetical protein
LIEATVGVTCEIIFHELKEAIFKEQDENTGLNMIKIK